MAAFPGIRTAFDKFLNRAFEDRFPWGVVSLAVDNLQLLEVLAATGVKKLFQGGPGLVTGKAVEIDGGVGPLGEKPAAPFPGGDTPVVDIRVFRILVEHLFFPLLIFPLIKDISKIHKVLPVSS
jgi:hypothetical protein